MSAADTGIPGSAVNEFRTPREIECVRSIIDAVCVELGVTGREVARRRAVTDRVMAAYRAGRRLPLNMVSAGLAETARHP